MLVKYSNTDSTILLMFLFFNYLWKDYGTNHLLLVHLPIVGNRQW